MIVVRSHPSTIELDVGMLVCLKKLKTQKKLSNHRMRRAKKSLDTIRPEGMEKIEHGHPSGIDRKISIQICIEHTLPTNIVPENRPSEKETSIPAIHF